MTVKFFSIYLQEIVLLTPSTVMIVSAVSTMVATFFSKIAERFTRCIGRVQTLILFRLGGVGTVTGTAIAASIDVREAERVKMKMMSRALHPSGHSPSGCSS